VLDLGDRNISSRPKTLLQRIRLSLSKWASALVVLWILLNSEAVRGITIPTQADYVKMVRREIVVPDFYLQFSPQ
jgi:hypothetical protein